jgi:energy-coupling factor transport system ATP-binding protein
VIVFDQVRFSYEGATSPALKDINLRIAPGQLVLVIGPTGSGKSTLLKAVNGLVPHFTGGRLDGRVTVGGLDTRTSPPRRLAPLVGYVGQDPAAGFVADRVEDELVYGMEQLGCSPAVMRARLEETLDLLGLAALRRRDPATLSAGQAQRVAMGAALAAHPQVLVLDEPTSALDPAAAEDTMAAISRLVHDMDLTVLMAEHRLERVIQFADQIVRLEPGGAATIGPPRDQLATSPVAPPVVRLGRRLGLTPVPLTVREARRAIREQGFALATNTSAVPDAAPPAPAQADTASGLSQAVLRGLPTAGPGGSAPAAEGGGSAGGEAAASATGPVVLAVEGINVTHPGPVEAVKSVDLTLRAGEVVGLMGRNGAGKTSLLWALTRDQRGKPRPGLVLVPSEPTDLFWADSVAKELGGPQADQWLDRLAPGIDRAAHPRDLSEGQRLALALAIQLSANTQVIALDEPTRGLDYEAKDRLRRALVELAGGGAALLIASHDVEFLAGTVERIIWLSEGEVVTEGPAGELLLRVPAHAPQVSKILAPVPALTIPEALAALGADQ